MAKCAARASFGMSVNSCALNPFLQPFSAVFFLFGLRQFWFTLLLCPCLIVTFYRTALQLARHVNYVCIPRTRTPHGMSVHTCTLNIFLLCRSSFSQTYGGSAFTIFTFEILLCSPTRRPILPHRRPFNSAVGTPTAVFVFVGVYCTHHTNARLEWWACLFCVFRSAANLNAMSIGDGSAGLGY